MGLDLHDKNSLWKDRALIELNQAVLYSFRKAGVKIIDHHSASKQFMQFMRQEEKEVEMLLQIVLDCTSGFRIYHGGVSYRNA